MIQSKQAQLFGYVALVGRPNVGKSTLLNALVRQEISITANRPQTTRNSIRGIVTKDHWQAVVVDTPGIHQPNNELHQRIVSYAKEGASAADLVIFVTEPIGDFDEVHRGDQPVLEHLKSIQTPVILVVNKIDGAKPEEVLKTLQIYNEAFAFADSVPLAAINKKNLKELEKLIEKYLPEGEWAFPSENLTDQPERLIVAELVREQIFRRCFKEIPYSVAVVIDKFTDEGSLLRIFATIYVEREAHKRIVIGKGGKMLKEVGQYSRIKMEYLLGAKVYLDLHVKIAPNWYNDPGRLSEFGYGKDQ